MPVSPDLGFSLNDPLRLLWEFSGTLAWRVLGVIWHASWAYYGISLAQFLDSLLLQGDHLLQDSSMASQNNCSRPSCFGKGWFPHPICRSSSWRADWPDQGAFRTWRSWSSRHRDFFRSLERMLRSGVLLNYRPSSLRIAAVTGSVVDWRWLGKIDKALVLEMEIYPALSYLVSWLVI